jgi:putative MATE family efflux protein
MIDASRQSVTLGLIVGVVLTFVAWTCLPQLAAIFTDRDGPVYAELMRYVSPALIGVPATFLFAIVAASLRAIGDTKRPMYVSGAQVVLHIILNYLLIFPTRVVEINGWELTIPGANMGIAGAGWSIAISAWFAAIVYLPVASKTILGPVWKLQWLALSWVKRVVRIAIPASASALIRIVSMASFMLVLKHTVEGERVYGAVRVGFAMESIAFMPAFGYMIAASALVGQSLGMKDPQRAERLASAAAKQTTYIIAVLSVLFFIFAPWFADIFLRDEIQHQAATNYLRIIAITEVLFGIGVVYTGALQGAGDTIRPTIVTLVVQLGLRTPAAWFFAVYLGHNSTAAWWVMSITQAISGVLLYWLFKQGKWKDKQV